MPPAPGPCPPSMSAEECAECRAHQMQELAELRTRVRGLERALDLQGQAPPLPLPAGLDLAAWKLVAEHAQDFVSLHASDGRYLYVSPVVEGVVGWSAAELLGGDPYAWIHPSDIAVVADRHARQLLGEPLRVEYRIRHKRGHYVWVETVARATVVDGQVQHIVCITRDMRERRQAEERLRESNRRLRDFASVAAHDLKAPLQTISSFAEIVLEGGAARALPPGERRMLERVVEHSQRMAGLVDDLLVWSRMESEEQPIGPTCLDEVVRRAVDGLDAAIRDSGARVHVDRLPMVTGNANLLQALLQNLVANAIKFTPPDRDPEIRISAHRGDAAWLLEVRDNGRGMSVEERQGIFEMFRRGERVHDVPGHGIGLALCARIAAFHGGSIELQSEPDRGSIFTTRLPDPDPIGSPAP